MEKYTEAEILAFISEHPETLSECLVDGKMDMDSVQRCMKEANKREVIAQYIDKIKKMGGQDGRYYIHVYDHGKRKKIRAKTHQELIDKIYAWHMAQQDPAADPTAITISDLWERFVEYKTSGPWEESTAIRNQCLWRSTISKCDIVDVPIVSITLTDLETWAYGLIRDKRLTKKAWKNIHGIMRGIFRLAEREGIIEKNVYTMLEIENHNVFRTPETKLEEELVLTPEQEIRLYQVCLDRYQNGAYPRNVLLPLSVIFAFQTGIRPSELIAVKEGDIRAHQLHVTRYYSEKRNCVIEEHTKAGHGPRRIDLTALAEGIVEEVLRYRAEHGIVSEYIFLTDDDQMLSFYNRLRKTFPILCRDAGIPHNTMYAGRRTFVSSLLDSGTNLQTIKKYVGHIDIKTTLDHYNHDRSTQQQKRERLEAARPSIDLDSLGLSVSE